MAIFRVERKKMSWTLQGNLKGPQGDPGVAAGFGIPSATVDSSTGTPSVTVNASGPDTAKVFEFDFHNLKGDKGDKGEDGTGVNILGSYNSYQELIEAHPSGSLGDAYLVNGDLYVWDGDSWNNVGSIQGPQGPRGETGAAAGFGTVNATINENVGVPSVSVSSDGPDTAKNFTFTFQNLKGETGDQGPQGPTGATGAAAGFGNVTATVDSNVGTPSVTVTPSGTDTSKNFAFAFHNLKGATGDKGDTGDQGPQGPQGNPGVDGTDGLSITVGQGAPISTAPVGSSYIDSTTGDLYVMQ